MLEIYVFDDADPEPATYLGLAKVPLITLANDKPIKGTFELRKASRVTGLHGLGMALIAFINGFSAQSRLMGYFVLYSPIRLVFMHF